MKSDGFMCHDMLYVNAAPLGDTGSSPICNANSNRIISKPTSSHASPLLPPSSLFLVYFLYDFIFPKCVFTP